MKYVIVQFYNDTTTSQWGQREYTYLAEDNQVIEGAEYAVVVGPYDVVKAVKIKSVGDFDRNSFNGKYKFIVCMVDLSSYQQRIDRINEMETIRRELKRRAQKAFEERTWKDILKDDEEAQQLLIKLDELDK